MDRLAFRLCLILLTTLLCVVVQAQSNFARQAKVTVSSSRPEFPLELVNDGDLGTSWSTATNEVKAQWLRLDWNTPQTFSGIVMYSTGPWTQTIEAQIRQGDQWVTIGKSGSATKIAPLTIVFTCKPVSTTSIRFLFDGGAAFYEVEVYNDARKIAQIVKEHVLPRIVVASDLRGHLLGTVSVDAGAEGIDSADVTISGQTRNGTWRFDAKTDKDGFFQAGLPFGTIGTIHLAARKGEIESTADVDVSDLSTVLSPRPMKDRLSLDGLWDWSSDASRWSKVKVPAHWEMEGLVSETGSAVYRRSFTVPASWKGKRIKLRADAVYSRCEVWANGKRVGSHEGGATPFEMDVTDAVRPGSPCELRIKVDERSRASDLDNASVFADFELAGIWQSIEVFAVDPVHVSHLAVTTAYDASDWNAELALEVDLVREGLGSIGSHEVRFQLFDPHGRLVPSASLQKKIELSEWSLARLELKAKVESPEPWNAEAPRLYKLVGFVDGKKVIEQPVGFRQIEIKNRAVTLNGTPLKIRGISKLDCHPLTGRALTPEIDKLDTEMIKSANFNAVRATIFPPHPLALDLADKTGLYYENEGPTCWGNHANDLRYVPIYAGVMCEYLERDRNHPSVIDWSICNESDYGRVFSITKTVMQAIDPTRIYSATWGDDTLDTATMHHPVNLQRIKESLDWPKPVFFDEVLGLFHGWEDLALWLDLDPGMKDYWVEGIPEILRAINAGPNQLGTIQFCWSDDTSLVPGKGVDVWRHEQPPIRYTESIYKMPKRGMVGDVVWGTVDGWRRPRPEYWLSKKLYSPVQIEEKPLSIPVSGSVVVPVENFNQFVNLNRYGCKWSMGSQKGQARAECKPMSKGSLTIPVSTPPKSNDVLALTFFDETGRLVDSYKLPFKAHELPVLPSSGRPARLVEQGGYLDMASAIRMIGKDCEIAYDRTSAALLRGLKNREVVLNAGPTLRLLKTTAPAEVYPTGLGLDRGVYGANTPTTWKLASATYRTEGAQAVLEWKGSYGKDLVGGFEIRMDDAGDIEIRYAFTYNGEPISVREIGLEFALPLSFDTLKWDRRAEYSVYPADHIGRPQGTALAHPGVPQTVPPGSRPFGLDDHPWGSNDFRSTKRNVYWASLTSALGEGVKVISNGTQHIRATVSTHDILLRVMDWYGGEGKTYSGGFHYGDGKHLSSGDVVQGTVRLQLVGSKN